MKFSLQEMVAQTLAESDRRVKLAEADSSADGEDTSIAQGGKGATKPAASNPNTAPDRNEQSIEEKTSSAKTASVSTEYINKLASAVEYLNGHMKLATEVGPGTGPNALETNVNTPTPGTQNYETGQATSQNQPPKNPGTAPASVPGNAAPATSLENDYEKRPGGEESWANKDVLKQGAAEGKCSKCGKECAPGSTMCAACQDKTKTAGKLSRVLNIMKKVAENMSPEVSASGEGVPALPGPASTQANLVSSNEAATNYTKQQAKAEPKAQMGEVLSEPAQVKSTDPVLQNNLSETAEAGTKISSAVKTAAAARALLQKVAEESCAEGASPEAKAKGEKLKELLAKQEKTSQGLGQSTMPIGGGI